VADIFNKIPSYGLVRDWLGTETVERLLQFAQTNENRFQDAEVIMHGEEGRLDRARRVSKRLGLGDLRAELSAKVTDLLPLIFERLGINPFKPNKIEVELVGHGDGAFFCGISIRLRIATVAAA